MSRFKSRLPLLIYFLIWILYFALFWSRALFINPEGGLSAGHVNVWGDWAAHLTMGNSLAERGLFTTESPFLIGTRFSYPYAANWFSALLMKLNVPMIYAFTVPSFIFCVMGVGSLYFFYKTLFNSTKQALVASLIFLWNGGIGFYFFAQDIINSNHPLLTLINPKHEYTRLDREQLKWISVIDSMFVPQRAFTLGFPLTLLAVGLIYQVLIKKVKLTRTQKNLRLLVASVILGWMPIIHTHSFLAAGIILSFWLLSVVLMLNYRRKSEWLPTILPWLAVGFTTLLFAIPLYLHFFSGQVGSNFIKWYPGWLAREFKLNWLWFWFKNWGITPLLAILGLGLVLKYQTLFKSRLQTLLIFLPFLLLFALSNLILFQPFSWDNTKIIIWSAVGIAGLSSVVIMKVWNYGQTWCLKLATKIVAGTLFLVMILSGLIDWYWIVRTDLHSYQMHSAEEITLSQWAKQHTNPQSIWLTGDQHNHWLYNLAGRQPLLTYRGWLWSHGYKYHPVEKDVGLMFKSPQQHRSLFDKYGIDYVVVGWNEKEAWKASESAMLKQFEVVHQSPNYVIFSTHSN